MSFVFGNFYVINLVLALQLMHVSNRWTLIIGTGAPLLVLFLKAHSISVTGTIKNFFIACYRILKKERGMKLSFVELFEGSGKKSVQLFFKTLKVLKRNPIDPILFVGIGILLWWKYGSNLIKNFGYCASDIPVHNYWINSLGQGKLFVAGVYPFGFHCVIYYLHAVFGIPTYVLLRVFCFVQTCAIHWMLLLFLKMCLKTRYLAYLGTGAFIILNIFSVNTYYRYYSSLPQEFGMIFILPSIYFGFAFFEYRKKELDTGLKVSLKKLTHSKWCLIGFAMSFSLTLAVHFYDTIIAGIFCVAMAIGYFFRLFRKQYFGIVVLTCMISVMIAVLPMAIAYATGTPLEGSLRWAMSIMSSSEEEDTTIDTTIDETVESSSMQETETSVEMTSSSIEENIEENTTIEPVKTVSFKEKLTQLLDSMNNTLVWAVLPMDTTGSKVLIYGCMGVLFILALLFFLFRENDYAARMISVFVYLFFMNVLLCSSSFGLPSLMDSGRTSIYFAYAIPILWSITLDGMILLVLRWFRRDWIYNGCSLLVIVGISYLLVTEGFVGASYGQEAFETNEAITCLTNILHDNEDFTWTICSANDELRMCEDYGYHYEPISLLWQIENIGAHANVTIPTKYTYFFIEKIPIAYTVYYENSGQSISEEGAKTDLPATVSTGAYQGENRWIVMSHMYYWAETFRKMYPENMTIYYESDNFICYRLEQNVDSLLELGIDYGYNNFEK
jgi:hypothetical protein